MSWLERTELLLGEKKLKSLINSNILIVGLGGVGAYAAENLCRTGVGSMTIVDADVVEHTNRNRQLVALKSTEGIHKTEVLAQRFKDINPDINLNILNEYLHENRMEAVLTSQKFDYVVDAIDTLSPKIALIKEAINQGIPLISSMGSGGKTDPSQIKISDISQSYNCRLAKVLRKRLTKLGIKEGFKVVFSPEEIDKEAVREENGTNKKSVVGTISYMPPLFGCFIASVVIQDLTQRK